MSINLIINHDGTAPEPPGGAVPVMRAVAETVIGNTVHSIGQIGPRVPEVLHSRLFEGTAKVLIGKLRDGGHVVPDDPTVTITWWNGWQTDDEGEDDQ